MISCESDRTAMLNHIYVHSEVSTLVWRNYFVLSVVMIMHKYIYALLIRFS